MRYFVVFLLFLSLSSVTAQIAERTQRVSGTVLDDTKSKPLPNVNIINLNSVRGTITDDKGVFEICNVSFTCTLISNTPFSSVIVPRTDF